MINSNKGMFLETLINQTAVYYQSKNICWIFKREVPIKIVSNDGQYIKGKIKSKSESDYYGVYNSKMFDFEAKQTINEDFPMSMIKQHQLDHLINIKEFGVLSFVIIHFIKSDEYFVILSDQLKNFINKSKIEYNWIKKNCYKLNLIFPGILDLQEFLSDFYRKESVYNEK